MRRISKRLETLERAADREIFAEAFPFAIAYYLGGARDLSEATLGYARALGYKDQYEFLPSFRVFGLPAISECGRTRGP